MDLNRDYPNLAPMTVRHAVQTTLLTFDAMQPFDGLVHELSHYGLTSQVKYAMEQLQIALRQLEPSQALVQRAERERLHAELLDAWEGEGNASRITFSAWLTTMADNPQGTLQNAAQRYLAS